MFDIKAVNGRAKAMAFGGDFAAAWLIHRLGGDGEKRGKKKSV
jgi:hypothetical protein